MTNLRNRFAMLLVLAMGAAGAVTTQAAADISMVRENMTVAKDTVFTDSTTAPGISIVFKDAIEDSSGSGYKEEVFYVEISNAEFADEMFSQQTLQSVGAVSITKQDKKVIKVVIKPTSRERGYVIPLLVKMTGGKAQAVVRANGSNTTISDWGQFSSQAESSTAKKEQDQTQAADESSRTVTMSFTLNNSTYTYNGEKVTMDAVPFIQAPGFMMVPVRYVAKVAGIEEEDITFEKGMITLNLKEGKQLILKAGSKECQLNGKKIELETAVMIQNNRTYVPIGAVARLLDIETKWDQDTKTAEFSRK